MDDQILRNWPLDKIRILHLEMGMQCNVRCIMCYQTDFSPKSRMPEIVWKERLLPVYANAKFLVISGGEPTVLPNCKALLQMVTRDYSHLQLDMVTNGILFEGMWEEAFLAQGDVINFSLNAVSSDLYHRIVQYGNFEKVTGNIHRLVHKKAETGSKLKVRISTVALDATIDELPKFVQWAVDNGLDQALIFTDYFGRIRHVPPSLVQRRIAEAYEIAERNPAFKLISLEDFDWYYADLHGLKPVRPRTVFQRPQQPCPSPFETLYVNSDGSVKPCCRSWYLFGNLLTSSVENVWQSRAAYTFRRRMLKLDFRDCTVACDLNCRPVHRYIADLHKAYWVIRRNPRSAFKKGLRRFGLTSAQTKQRKP